jgi:hypothetical protein
MSDKAKEIKMGLTRPNFNFFEATMKQVIELLISPTKIIKTV